MSVMKTESYFGAPQDRIPNNRLPLLVLRNAIPSGGADAIIARFRENGWSNNWRNRGIYTYPHFHSTTHECLGCAQGWIDFHLSVGEDGRATVRINAGDVIVMPAGVSHEDGGHSEDVLVCGGYPDGREWDNVRPDNLSSELYKKACKRIMALPIPERDPVTGNALQEWHDAPPATEVWIDWRNRLDASA